MALNFPASPTTAQVYTPGGGLPSYQWNGSAWLNIGSGSVADSFAYTATGSEGGGGTIVPVTGGYLANLAIVTRNGALQTPGDDVDITSGTNVVFAAPLTAGETIYVLKFRAFSMIDALMASQNFADVPSKPAARANLSLWGSVIADQTLTANATQFADIDIGAFSMLRFELEVAVNAAVADFAVYARFSFDGGATFPAGVSEYTRVAMQFNTGGVSGGTGTLDAAVVTTGIDTANAPLRAQARGSFRKGGTAHRAHMESRCYANDGTNNNASTFENFRNSSGLATHVRFFATVANGLGVGSRLTVEGRV